MFLLFLIKIEFVNVSFGQISESTLPKYLLVIGMILSSPNDTIRGNQSAAIKIAGEIAISKINANPNILQNAEVILRVRYADQPTPFEMIQVADLIEEDNINVLITDLEIDRLDGAIAVAADSDIPACILLETRNLYNSNFKLPNFFSMATNEAQSMYILINYAAKMGWNEIAILYSQDDFGIAAWSIAQSHAEKKKRKVSSSTGILHRTR